VRLIPAAARRFHNRRQEEAYAEAERVRAAEWAHIADGRVAGEIVDLSAALVTVGDAPGYRDVHLTVDLVPIGGGPKKTMRASIGISPADGERIARHIHDVHVCAWDRSSDRRPLDARPEETRPGWLDGQR
jgi:hypothetical protein